MLGSRYATREEAEKEATDTYVCHRCNYVSVVYGERYENFSERRK